MTFVFYFFLVNLPFDTEERHDVWFNSHVTINESGFIIKAKQQENDHLKVINRFNDEITDAANSILEVIKSDKELTQLFRNTLNEIKENFTLPESVLILDKVVG